MSSLSRWGLINNLYLVSSRGLVNFFCNFLNNPIVADLTKFVLRIFLNPKSYLGVDELLKGWQPYYENLMMGDLGY